MLAARATLTLCIGLAIAGLTAAGVTILLRVFGLTLLIQQRWRRSAANAGSIRS
jgi:hypothetical protein